MINSMPLSIHRARTLTSRVEWPLRRKGKSEVNNIQNLHGTLGNRLIFQELAHRRLGAKAFLAGIAAFWCLFSQ